MKKILFVSSSQYGYNTDYYKYCEYLSDEYIIYFVCFDSHQPKYEISKIQVFYTKYKKGFVSKRQLIDLAIEKIENLQPDLVLIKYFPGCSRLYRKFPDRKMVIDIRTGSVEKSQINRTLKDFLKRIEANRFRHITVITEGLAKKLKLDMKKTYVLPLGADRLVSSHPQLNQAGINLLYIGTFDQRNIVDTIKGYKLFYDEYKNIVPSKYTIIGFGYEAEKKKITESIQQLALEQNVLFLGRKKYDELKEYYESHNVGVSYIPITEYFQFQPPTKTYEYICNGLACIATKTYENAKVIHDENGILINEGPVAFYTALKQIYNKLDQYGSEAIMKNSEKYSWESIVNNIMKPYLAKILMKQVIDNVK